MRGPTLDVLRSSRARPSAAAAFGWAVHDEALVLGMQVRGGPMGDGCHLRQWGVSGAEAMVPGR